MWVGYGHGIPPWWHLAKAVSVVCPAVSGSGRSFREIGEKSPAGGRSGPFSLRVACCYRARPCQWLGRGLTVVGRSPADEGKGAPRCYGVLMDKACPTGALYRLNSGRAVLSVSVTHRSGNATAVWCQGTTSDLACIVATRVRQRFMVPKPRTKSRPTKLLCSARRLSEHLSFLSFGGHGLTVDNRTLRDLSCVLVTLLAEGACAGASVSPTGEPSGLFQNIPPLGTGLNSTADPTRSSAPLLPKRLPPKGRNKSPSRRRSSVVHLFYAASY